MAVGPTSLGTAVSFQPTRTIVLDGPDPEAKRQEILEYFHQSFSLYESLFECLKGDAGYYARANRLCSCQVLAATGCNGLRGCAAACSWAK